MRTPGNNPVDLSNPEKPHQAVLMVVVKSSPAATDRRYRVNSLESKSLSSDRTERSSPHVVKKDVLDITKPLVERAKRGVEELVRFRNHEFECLPQRISRFAHSPLGLKPQSDIGPELYRALVALQMKMRFRFHRHTIGPPPNLRSQSTAASRVDSMMYRMEASA